jgi:hypothetical protein
MGRVTGNLIRSVSTRKVKTINGYSKYAHWNAVIYCKESHKGIDAPFAGVIDKLEKAMLSGLFQILQVNFSLETLGSLSTNPFYQVGTFCASILLDKWSFYIAVFCIIRVLYCMEFTSRLV